MDEFLKQNYTLITHSVEIIAALTAIFCYKKFKNNTTKYFIWFLVYIVIIEMVGSYPSYVVKYEFLDEARLWLKDSRFKTNNWFFTIFWIIGGTMFYGMYFRKILRNPFYKNVLRYALFTFGVFCIVYISLYWDLFFKGRTISIDVFGVIVIMLAVILYLVEILKSDEILRFYKSIHFYIAITLILWYIIVTPLSFYHMYFSKADWNFVILKYQIYLFANLCMYLTFTFALIYCKPEK